MNKHEEKVKYWYDWSVANWGTKWNAYGCKPTTPEDGCLEFFTAWDYVPDIIKKLSRVFPDAELRYRWADEDIGHGVGEVTLKNAEVINENIPESRSNAAYELAAEIMQVDLADYDLYLKKDGSNYEYREASVELAKQEPVKPKATPYNGIKRPRHLPR